MRVHIPAIAAALTLAPHPALAQDSFFAGRTISLIIGFGPGGTYDYYARLVARHLGKHIPGKPNVIAQQMAGAGSFTAANYLYSVAPKDGTAMGTVTQTLAIEEAIRTPGVKYQSAQFNWIGRATSIVQIQLTMSTSKIRTLADALVNDTPAASTGAGSPTEGYPKLLNGVIGSKFRSVGPYPGSVDGLLAMERGEVETSLTSWNTIKASRPQWIAEKKINILVQYSRQRLAELPDVPAFTELGKTAEDKQLLAFYVSAEEIGRSFLAPPGMPADRVATLRAAFDAFTKDAEVLAEVAKINAEFNPMSGVELQKLVAEVANTPTAIVDRMQALLR